ncbi:tyrosine-protein phosphatase [Nocardia brevicatena]|uniref:tyrosine-protein phosphatase n=1 Tax=Nocardia brevicatena TaxID=37327 RepID=UPI0002F8C6D0|nr:tyrosine-protein phosphatase [Nocardia brevicatena]
MTSSTSADHLRIRGTFNYRDLGGLRTIDGAQLRPGVLLRSAQLSRVDENGHATLRELGVRAVHDLRGHREIERAGHDHLPPEIRLVVTPFYDSTVGAPPHERAGETAELSALTYMFDVYRNFPARPQAHAAIVAIAKSIVAEEGAVLVHCAAGKDRTGWAIATLLRAVGVTEEDILADYLLSNRAVAELRAAMREELGPERELADNILGVREEYLRAANDAVRDLHGEFETYMSAVGLTRDLRTRLRARLVD